MSVPLTRREVISRSASAVAFAGIAAATSSLFVQPTIASADTTAAPNWGLGFKDGVYVLPALAYAYDALEPHIDEATMHLHHDKHHQAYVNGLNSAIKALAALAAPDAPENAPLLAGLQEDLSFNAGGHFLHTLFWQTMAPSAGGEPQGALADALAKDFGSVEAFRTRFARVAAGVKGSGWALLAHEPIADRLLIVQVKQHDLQLPVGVSPLLPLDVWEHAYYLKYKNARAEYVKAWWNAVNWPTIDAALAASRKQHAGS
jgi:superoxide dismutase, Fe-Mn family